VFDEPADEQPEAGNASKINGKVARRREKRIKKHLNSVKAPARGKPKESRDFPMEKGKENPKNPW